MGKSGVQPYPSSPLGKMQQSFDSQQQRSQKITSPLERNILYPAQSNGESCAQHSATPQGTTCAQNCKRSQRPFSMPRSHVPDALGQGVAVC